MNQSLLRNIASSQKDFFASNMYRSVFNNLAVIFNVEFRARNQQSTLPKNHKYIPLFILNGIQRDPMSNANHYEDSAMRACNKIDNILFLLVINQNIIFLR